MAESTQQRIVAGHYPYTVLNCTRSRSRSTEVNYMGLVRKMAKAAKGAAADALKNRSASPTSPTSSRTNAHGEQSEATRTDTRTMAIASLSLEEKEVYFTPIFNAWMLKICSVHNLRPPLEVWTRGSGGEGLFEIYFANTAHMRYFCHKLYGVPMEGNTEALLDGIFGEYEEDDKVRIEGSQPVRMIKEYPTYSALVEWCYTTAKGKEEQYHSFEREAQQKAQNIAVATANQQSFNAEMQRQNEQMHSDMMRHNEEMNGIYQQQMTANNQLMGFEPTHYVDGVPHYLGGPGSVADAFRN